MAMIVPPLRTLTVNDPLYSREMLRLATRLAEFPLLESVPWVERRSPICGSQIMVGVELDRDRRIVRLGQHVRACAFGQASAALMALSATGKTLSDLIIARDALAGFLKGDRDSPGEWPGLNIFAGAQPLNARHAAILLPFDAVIEATQDASHA